MFQPAINLINPGAACPDWCTAEHSPEDYIAPPGWWDITHRTASTRVPAINDEVYGEPETQLHVFVGSYSTEESSGDLPPLVCLEKWDHEGDFGLSGSFRLTASQAVRLAEVLVQQASALLALQADEESGAGR